MLLLMLLLVGDGDCDCSCWGVIAGCKGRVPSLCEVDDLHALLVGQEWWGS